VGGWGWRGEKGWTCTNLWFFSLPPRGPITFSRAMVACEQVLCSFLRTTKGLDASGSDYFSGKRQLSFLQNSVINNTDVLVLVTATMHVCLISGIEYQYIRA